MSAKRFEDSGTSLIQLDFWETELLTELRRLTSQEPSEATRAELSEVVNQLFTLLPVQFDAKTCDDDYLQNVLDEFPSWETQVNALRLEQAFLYEDLREIRDHLADGFEEGTFRALLPVVAEWSDRLQKHEAEERRLSQIAINLDLGGPGG